MSEPESDDDNFCLYGTPLELFDEDEVPKKKPINIEDQIATDSQGRRRFHGAFTGGFSAGFCNTVGSLEGWAPSTFKSSRSDKNASKSQRPEDFMDDEDLGDFGIAPTVLKPTDDYDSVKDKKSRKRKFKTIGAIPGRPVLEMFLQPAKETVGVKLLKQMGWKPGQGVGPRITKSEKRKIRQDQSNSTKIYGCEIPEEFRKPISDESDSEDDTLEITFAPDDYELYVCKPKENTFGMGYSGLEKRSVLSRFSLFDEPASFSMVDRNNKKLSVQGQAFGVGAFEEEDEDIYSKDDMSRYDFELEDPNKISPKKIMPKLDKNVLTGFVLAKNPVFFKKKYPPPILPKSFVPIHGVRRSRFEPLPEKVEVKSNQFNQTVKQQEKTNLSATDRTTIFNDTKAEEMKSLEKAKEITALLPKTNNLEFKPFTSDLKKQQRYEEYLKLLKTGDRNKLVDSQPFSMTEWEKDQERMEFEKAAKMFTPSSSLVFDRFVPAKHNEDLNNPLADTEKLFTVHGTEDMINAAKMKMFGKLTRETATWRPSSLLCKRFNVAEPDVGCAPANTSKKSKKYSLFDYLEVNAGINKKEIPTQDTLNSQNDTKNAFIEDKIETHTPNIINKETDISHVSINENEDKIKGNETVQNNKFIEFAKENEEHIIKEKSVDLNKEEKIIVPEDPDERIDLFKAIFLSSSESENENDNDNEERIENKFTEMKQMIIEENQQLEKVNELRNTSPPKGIFANIDFDALNKKASSNNVDTIVKLKEIDDLDKKEEILNENVSQADVDLYGPKLPNSKIETSDFKIKSASIDGWVEKSESRKVHKHKKRKKEKKEKHKHKSKSKHKKKKH